MDQLAKEVERLGPWITRFTVSGVHYGGTYDPINDDRVSRTMAYFPHAPRILELGCLEGGHTVVLSRVYPTSQILAIDARPDNIERAKFLTSFYGCKRVAFCVDDLEVADMKKYGEFDLCVCMGLLYHLEKPWNLLRQLGQTCQALWIWTTICAETEADTTVESYRGRMFSEGPTEHPLSALRRLSFFPTLGSLIQMLNDAGFREYTVMNMETTPNGPSVQIACSKRPYRLNQ